MKKLLIIILALFPVFASGQRVVNSKLVDTNGKELILHGINLVVKDSIKGFMDINDSLIFRKIKSWGMNVIRYGVSWCGIEPKCGKIDKEYLRRLDKRIDWARECGIMLILDMHQDLYAQQWADGAPHWAVFTDGLPHKGTKVWSDAYMESAGLQRAVDNFWQNRPAADGIGIQDHFIKCWTILTNRYKDSKAVIGFDILNEPFPGSISSQILSAMVDGYAQTKGLPIEQIETIMSNPDWLANILTELSNPNIYRAVTDAAQPISDSFERGALSDFYQKTRNAIRKSGCNKILFLEHNYFCNMGVKSTFTIPVSEDGTKDSQVVYAPHAYDLVTDRAYNSKIDNRRFDFIISQIEKSAKERSLPVWVGEWGAFYDGNSAFESPAKFAMEQFKAKGWGQAIWSYWDGIDNHSYFQKYLILK